MAQKAARHWFKHAGYKDLSRAKIAESVRAQLGRAFRDPYDLMLKEQAGEARVNSGVRRFIARITTYQKAVGPDRKWG